MKRRMKLTTLVLLAALLCLPSGALTLTPPEQATEIVTAEIRGYNPFGDLDR